MTNRPAETNCETAQSNSVPDLKLASHSTSDAGTQGDYIRGGLPVRGDHLLDEKKISLGDFFAGAGTMHETYAMTDDVTDDDFETAIEDAKDEGNVSIQLVRIETILDRILGSLAPLARAR